MSATGQPLPKPSLAWSLPVLICAWLGTSPLLLVTVRGWSNVVLIIGAVLCMVYLYRHNALRPASRAGLSPHIGLLGWALTLPVVAILVSAGLRVDFYLPQLDSPLRFCLAIPVLWFVIHARVDAARLFQYLLPAALALTLAQQWLVPQPRLWGPERMSTYFADPLVFGYFALTCALMCLVSIRLTGPETPLTLGLKLAGLAVGFYLSVQSGSRTGWLAIPLVIGLWLQQITSKRRLRLLVLACAVTALLAVVLYLGSGTLQGRVDKVVNEVLAYSWTGIAPDTSVGMRITFLRIAGDLFFLHPWAGFGETRFERFAVPPAVLAYASPVALRTAFEAGFHNEIVTSAIRAGVPGLLAAAAMFLVPLYILGPRLKSGHPAVRANATLGITFVVCMLVSSLSTEVFDLKYTVSYYALMVAVLCGSALAPRHE